MNNTLEHTDTGTRHRILLPYDRPPKGLTGNRTRGNPYAHANDTKRVRADVTRLATEAGLTECEHLVVALVWAPGTRHRRDADNLWPLLKVCCDALAKGPRKDWVGLTLVPDDTAQYMTKHAPQILTPDETDEVGMWLTVDCLDAPPPTEAELHLEIAELRDIANSRAVVPLLAYPGGSTQAEMYRASADRLDAGYAVGGSGMTAAVVQLMRNAADALDSVAVRSGSPRAAAEEKRPSDRPGASEPGSPVSPSAEPGSVSDALNGPGKRADSEPSVPCLPLDYGQNRANVPGKPPCGCKVGCHHEKYPAEALNPQRECRRAVSA